MTATSNFKFTPAHTLLVYGVSTDNVPYEVEIDDPQKARVWFRVLAYSKYQRSTMGPEPSRPRPK